MTSTLSDDYVIETAGISSVLLEGFTPKRRVAFVIQGAGATLSPSFDMMADCLVQRGYNDIIAIRDAPHVFCRERKSLHKENIVGLLGELAAQLSDDDVLFTAILGASYTKTGVVYLPIPRSSSEISSLELRELFSSIPVHHAVHYVSPDIHAGDLAKRLSQAEHPDLGNRHIAIAPTIPSVSDSSLYHKVPTGKHQHVEVVTPFHAAFFDLADKQSLRVRFEDAAQYQREIRKNMPAYMCYGAINPQAIAFRREVHH